MKPYTFVFTWENTFFSLFFINTVVKIIENKLVLSPAPLPSSTNLDSDSLSSPARLSVSLSECEEHLDRLQQVELARSAPMSRWRAGTVQAWLEVIMAMPMYIRACADNVKSGKVDVTCIVWCMNTFL